jgi:type III secretion protein N (ATPase)
MSSIATPEHKQAASKIRELMVRFQEIELLVRIGEYQKGSDPLADEALDKIDRINAFLRQGAHEIVPFQETVSGLMQIASS